MKSILSLALIFVFAAMASARSFEITKKPAAGRKYEERCESSDLVSANFETEDDVEELVKFMKHRNLKEAWIGSVEGVETDGNVMIHIVYDYKGKYDYHYYSVYPSKALEKRNFTQEFLAICAKPEDK